MKSRSCDIDTCDYENLEQFTIDRARANGESQLLGNAVYEGRREICARSERAVRDSMRAPSLGNLGAPYEFVDE